MAGFKGITVAHLNIRSLNRKLEEVIRILAQGDVDILCLSETWLNKFVPDSMVSINGYNMIRQDRTADSGKTVGGGVMIYYKNYLDVSLMPDLCICDPSSEIMWVTLNLKQTRPHHIGLIYRPPDGDLDSTIESLRTHVSSLRARGNCDTMIIGDINVDWKRARENKTKKLRDYYREAGMTNLINEVTCNHNNNQSCIDHIVVARDDMYQCHGVIAINASDHNLVYAVRKQPKVEKTHKFIWARTYRRFDQTLFERDIIFSDWSDVCMEADANIAWHNFAKRLSDILEIHAPYRKMRISDSLPKWVTAEYMSACDERDHHFKIYCRNKTEANHNRMKRSRNYATNLKKALKRDYFRKSINENRGNSKNLWNSINEAFGKKKAASAPITKIGDSTDPLQMAERMNDYFSTIADELASQFPDEPPTRTEKVFNQPKFHFVQVDENAVEKLIKGLSLSTAVGVDGISPRILKCALKPISILISKLVNKSLNSGIFPDELKVARVSPIFKSGDRTDPGNYRPISVLPTVSKIFERVVHSQLSNYLDMYQLLSNGQFGFRRHHSTETCCLAMLDKIYKKLDQGCLGGVVFLDLKKAFDTVNHTVLLRKLSSLGVSDPCLAWFASYLSNRRQTTKVEDACSSEQTVLHGVPQGSILGPLLFLVFINDLCDSIELCGTSMYADDTAIFYLADSDDELQISLQYDLQTVSYWMRENRLSLNTSKTKFMKLGTKTRLKKSKPFSLSLNGDIIEEVSTFKYLGMTLDSQLQFIAHVDKVVDKTTAKLGLLYKTRWLFDQQTALTLYKSLITPHFDFGSVIYEVTPKYQLQRLQIVQNAAARLILLADPRCPVYELHENLNLDTLATRRAKSMVKLTYSLLLLLRLL